MVKKGLLVLIILALVAGGAFAQKSFSTMAKNTITVDVGPAIIGFGISPLIKMVGMEGLSGNGYGGAAQYERQLSKSFSVGVRGAFLSHDLGYEFSDSMSGIGYTPKIKLNLTSFSGEGHFRFYPLGDTFFLDGMVGYANLNADFSGNVELDIGGDKPISPFTADQNYLKLGVKFGWRISFGRNGGFTFEPALGYSYGLPLGDPLKDKISKGIGGTSSDVNDKIDIIEKYVYISGPRLSLAFGYRF